MKFIIESGSLTDIDELEKLYDELNDHLSANTITCQLQSIIRDG